MYKQIKFRASRLIDKLKTSMIKPDYGPKVFCIGFMKTGTTTLGKSFEMLGYRNSSYDYTVYRDYYLKNKMNKVLDYTARYESFDDLPWSLESVIPVMDEKFPKSKFVYLERDEESWKKSLEDWSFYQTNKKKDAEKFLIDFRNHKAFVLDYFKCRSSEEFIILDVRDENGFEKLADFLGKNTNKKAFPHFNKSKLGMDLI